MRRRARAARSTPGMRLRASLPPVVALLLVALAFALPDPSQKPREPRSVAVSRTAYACPPGVNVAAGQVAPATSVKATTLPSGTRQSRLELSDRWRLAKTSKATVVEQSGRGSGAVGFFTTTASAAQGGGLVVAPCPPTVDESWFVGLGSGGKHESRLVFTNLSDVIAVADVSLWGTEGPIDVVRGAGIIIKPHRTRTITVDKLAAGETELAARVERRRGAFAVTAFDGSRRVFSGSEVEPSSVSPKRDQLLAGLPAGARNRTLLVVNPSTVTSRLSVSVLGPRGSFAPRGLEAVRVPAGSVTAFDIPAAIGADGVSIRLKSDQPVAATVRFADEKKDYAYAVSARPLDGPALVPVDLGGGTSRPRLTVTAPGGKATVTVVGYDARMKRIGSGHYEIAAGATATVNLAKLTDSERLAYVVVTPKGNVIGSATFRKDDGIASIPLEAAPIRVLGPDVRYIG
ncbi:MAG TPA: DUF5719 family protein [Aeromicrobium sp.]|nr:DUF5719 family protein [Aeromicrobium sp.]